MSILNFFKKTKNVEKIESVNPIVSSDSKELIKKGPTLHEDLKGLIWIADGPNKNYSLSSSKSENIDVGSIRISISFLGQEEPSLIYTTQEIKKPSDESSVERPSYYPTYSSLTPEQKWIYLNLLTNPYDTSINIGYVFIIYYGLEHHLLKGNYEKAFRTILKLRDTHKNGSFQSYSANALILSALLHQRGDLVVEFIDSLDKEYEFNFSDNLLLLCYYSFDKPLIADDIVRMAKSFGFTNTNYIKKYPDIFKDQLKTLLLKKYGTDGIILKSIITDSELAKIRSTKGRIFANMSLLNEEIPVPQFINNAALKKEIYHLLETTHNNIKTLLAEKRKEGKPIPVKVETKKNMPLIFDANKEQSLLRDLNNKSNDIVGRHFLYIYLQDFYYKYRSLGDYYIEKCKEFCLLDINSLEEMFETYIRQEIEKLQNLKDFYGKDYINDSIIKIKEEGFIGSIPAFKRLSIIYENEGNLDEAIEICHQAIQFNQSDEYFKSRIEKLKNKQSK